MTYAFLGQSATDARELDDLSYYLRRRLAGGAAVLPSPKRSPAEGWNVHAAPPAGVDLRALRRIRSWPV